MNQHTYIIAEAGVNHNGSIELAKKLVDVAASSGVDAVKFQTFKTENLVSVNAKKAEYQKETTDATESQFQMIKKLELDSEAHTELIAYCAKKNITFLSTPFDLDSIQLLNGLGLDIFKIPSGEVTNLPYLEQIGKLNKKIVLSTGMCSMGDVENAIRVLESSGTPKSKITVLHANTQYPTQMEDVNLSAMVTMGLAFDVDFGYSDHTLGIEIPTAAVALGASVIEKHFTLDKTMEGPDHKASLEPDELKSMVLAIRNIEKALGDGVKRVSNSERPNMDIARKSIVASTNIVVGEEFTAENLAIKRPGNGISPMNWYEVIGRKASRNYQSDDLIVQE
jgi:N,N'-diacetyllegionaminate synthase